MKKNSVPNAARSLRARNHSFRKVNAVWHQKNPMPKNPTLQQKIEWHKAHARYCGCRPIPASIQSKITKES